MQACSCLCLQQQPAHAPAFPYTPLGPHLQTLLPTARFTTSGRTARPPATATPHTAGSPSPLCTSRGMGGSPTSAEGPSSLRSTPSAATGTTCLRLTTSIASARHTVSGSCLPSVGSCAAGPRQRGGAMPRGAGPASAPAGSSSSSSTTHQPTCLLTRQSFPAAAIQLQHTGCRAHATFAASCLPPLHLKARPPA
jgi:hypothetical protein